MLNFSAKASSLVRPWVAVGVVAGAAWPLLARASGSEDVATSLLWLALLLVAAKVSGLVERWGQPAVLGELVMGVVLGNLGLVGLHLLDPAKHDASVRFLAELGVVILLFQIGLESNLQQLKKVGLQALAVAAVGVVVPFVLGAYVVGPLLLPGLGTAGNLFVGATLTATSVGITARVLRDLGALASREAQIILGAAVIDDVLGLVILAVVSALATAGSITLGAVSLVVIKAAAFLVGGVVLGQFLAPRLGRWLSAVHTGVGMKFTLALSFGLVFAYLAHAVGLAPIVGAFAAGLVLDPVHFKSFSEPAVAAELREASSDLPDADRSRIMAVVNRHAHRHVEDLLEPVSFMLVPLFFVVTGMDVDLAALADVRLLLLALGVFAIAVFGKLVAGLAAGRGASWLTVGVGMVPRGEVGLIFAAVGRAAGVIGDEVFSVLVVVIILTTLVTPPVLAALVRRRAAA